MMMAAKKSQERLRIGPYQILAKIGEGGMGTVYLTKMDGPPGFNKLAVVKELRADLTGSRRLVEMFLNEVRLAARLTHPNVVHTYGANEADGSLYLAMEYLDGQPWSRIRHVLWQDGSLPFGLHVKVLAEMLAGLHYAHELHDYDGSALKVVHCDVSPQNVFVTYDGQVKVVDFGVACAVTGERRSGTKMLIGKLAYIAPEQARGEVLDRRADIFAVGVMLWEAIAGKRFAEGDDWRAMRERRAAGDEPRIRDVVPDAPAKLADICDRAMSLDPDDRFASAGEFREALLHYLAEDMQDADHAQLGEMVMNAFHADRARIHGLIERHLSAASARLSSIEDLVSSRRSEPAEHTLKADLSELASVSRLRDDVALISATQSASIRVEQRLPRGPIWAGVGGALVLLGGWLWSRPSEPPPRPSTPIVVTSLPPAPLPAVPPADVGSVVIAPPPAAAKQPAQIPATFTLSVSALPSETTFLLDGVPLRGNPYSEQRPTDSELHLLRAVGPGLQGQERVIAFDGDKAVTFHLARLPAAPVRPARAPVRRSAPPEPAPLAAAASPVASEPEAPAPAAPNRQARPADTAFDAPLAPANARIIYDEDPYR